MSMSTPVWMGLIFDRTGSYFWALLPLAGIYAMSAIGYLLLPQPRLPARLRAREEAVVGVGGPSGGS
jgi:hypothetical protein